MYKYVQCYSCVINAPKVNHLLSTIEPCWNQTITSPIMWNTESQDKGLRKIKSILNSNIVILQIVIAWTWERFIETPVDPSPLWRVGSRGKFKIVTRSFYRRRKVEGHHLTDIRCETAETGKCVFLNTEFLLFDCQPGTVVLFGRVLFWANNIFTGEASQTVRAKAHLKFFRCFGNTALTHSTFLCWNFIFFTRCGSYHRTIVGLNFFFHSGVFDILFGRLLVVIGLR